MTAPGTRTAPHATSTVALPPERAFVIQLRAASDGDAELFAGRAEHVASGEVAHFGSVPELVAFVRQVLATDATPAAGEASAGPQR